MRIPIWLVIVLSLATVSLTWWSGTRHYDFLGPLPGTPTTKPAEPPTEAGEAATGSPGEAVAEPPVPAGNLPPVQLPGPPLLSPGSPLPVPLAAYDEPRLPPALDAYLAEAQSLGAEEMAALAGDLERLGQFQRALLAWERVIDGGDPDLSWRTPAQIAIRRLRSRLGPWTPDGSPRIPLVIHVGADIRFGDSLVTAAEMAAERVELASSGLLKLEAVVTLGEAAGPETEALPVAVWLTDDAEPPTTSTRVLSFTSPPGAADALSRRILATIYELASGRLSDELDWRPLPELCGDGDPADAMETSLTRRAWFEFAESLQPDSPGP